MYMLPDPHRVEPVISGSLVFVVLNACITVKIFSSVFGILVFESSLNNALKSPVFQTELSPQ